MSDSADEFEEVGYGERGFHGAPDFMYNDDDNDDDDDDEDDEEEEAGNDDTLRRP